MLRMSVCTLGLRRLLAVGGYVAVAVWATAASAQVRCFRDCAVEMIDYGKGQVLAERQWSACDITQTEITWQISYPHRVEHFHFDRYTGVVSQRSSWSEGYNGPTSWLRHACREVQCSLPKY